VHKNRNVILANAVMELPAWKSWHNSLFVSYCIQLP